MLKDSRKINRFIDQLETIHSTTAAEAREIAFIPRQFILTPLPYSKPVSHRYQRKNGHYMLSMMADENIGLPYGGLARILLARLATEAIRKKSPVIDTGKFFRDFLKELNLSPSGGEKGDATRLKDQLLRISSTFISTTCEKPLPEGQQLIGQRLVMVRSFKLTWMNAIAGNNRELAQGNICLSQDFFAELTRKCIPVDNRVLHLLRKSPLQMDIYVWLTHRFSYLKKLQLISWQSLKSQFGSDYADTLQGMRDFRRKFLQSLSVVKMVYSQANIEESGEGVYLLPSPPHVKKISLKRVEEKGQTPVDNLVVLASYQRRNGHAKQAF